MKNPALNMELLTCRRLTAGIVYPPIQVQPPDLSRLYADLMGRHPYQNLQHLPDGVHMANPESDCLVQLGRTQVNENVMYFQASKEKCVDIFGVVSERFNIQQFLSFGVKLTAFLPMNSPGAAAELLQRGAFAVEDREWAILGSGRNGAGFRVVLHQDGVVDLRIEPFFNNTSELYVEVDIQHPEPFMSVATVGPWMDAAYNYLFGPVKDFLETLAK